MTEKVSRRRSGISGNDVVASSEMPLQDYTELSGIWESAVPDSINEPLPSKARIKKHKSRIEITNGRGFVWRSGSGDNRTSVYGGSSAYLAQNFPDRYKQYEKRHSENQKAKQKAHNSASR